MSKKRNVTKARSRSVKPVPAAPRTWNTDWARVDATTDADIARQIAEDPDTAPEWTEEMFRTATWVEPLTKTPISLRVDPDILEFFKEDGPGYQSRINAVLRAYVSEAKCRGERK